MNKKPIKNLEQVAELALQQVDTAGYYLGRYGITDRVNRHNLIALAMTRRERAKGELARLELKLALRRKQLRQLQQQLEQQLDQLGQTADRLIDRAPPVLAQPLRQVRSRLL
ncbi:MAG TPA: hypothetical protein VM553_08500 [Dongiaceae bacterium]|nr:hypothetical protein [Dongiaceae bacterium]